MGKPYELAFQVIADDPTDVRDLGNGLKEAIRSAQKRGQHEGVEVEGPTISPGYVPQIAIICLGGGGGGGSR